MQTTDNQIFKAPTEPRPRRDAGRPGSGLPGGCVWGRDWPSGSRTQGAALGGAKRKPEDAEARRARRVSQACPVGGSDPDSSATWADRGQSSAPIRRRQGRARVRGVGTKAASAGGGAPERTSVDADGSCKVTMDEAHALTPTLE